MDRRSIHLSFSSLNNMYGAAMIKRLTNRSRLRETLGSISGHGGVRKGMQP